MAKLPVLSGHDLMRLLQKEGFVALLGILKQCGLTKDDLLGILTATKAT